MGLSVVVFFLIYFGDVRVFKVVGIRIMHIKIFNKNNQNIEVLACSKIEKQLISYKNIGVLDFFFLFIYLLDFS